MRFALAGTAVLVILVLVDVSRYGGNPVSLVQPGEIGPSAAVFHRDFPDLDLLPGGGHDGQQFYAVARDPLHPHAVAPHLDRPRYRLQRPLYPLLAWALHPTGGGLGLVFALFAVGVLAAFGGGVATGVITTTRGGPAWAAAVFPLLPGVYAALRISTADTLAVALALGAIACSLRSRPVAAVALAVLAVLAKEPVILLLGGFGLWRKDRQGALLVAAPVAAAGALWAGLRMIGLPNGAGLVEFTLPFGGMATGLSRWTAGRELWSPLALGLSVGCGLLALRLGGLRSPFGWAIALQVAFVPLLAADVIAMNLNAPRATLPLLAAAVPVLATAVQARSRSIRAATLRRAGPVTSSATS